MIKSQGLSLIEMMITVAIVAILITVGVPGIQSMLIQNRVVATVNDISALSRYARFIAVDEQQAVTLCPTANYTDCSNNWQLAKMVFVDANADGSRNNSETLLRTSDAVTSSLAITGLATTLTFAADGSISSATTIKVCPSSQDAKLASAVLLSLYGRIATATDASGNDIKEDASGSDLSCS